MTGGALSSAQTFAMPQTESPTRSWKAKVALGLERHWLTERWHSREVSSEVSTAMSHIVAMGG